MIKPTPPTHEEFCTVIGLANHKRVPGHWKGASFGYHCYGIMRNNMLLIVHGKGRFSEIFIHTHPKVKYKSWLNDPDAMGNAIPRPKKGGQWLVYEMGKWVGYGKWQAEILDILDELKEELEG